MTLVGKREDLDVTGAPTAVYRPKPAERPGRLQAYAAGILDRSGTVAGVRTVADYVKAPELPPEEGYSPWQDPLVKSYPGEMHVFRGSTSRAMTRRRALKLDQARQLERDARLGGWWGAAGKFTGSLLDFAALRRFLSPAGAGAVVVGRQGFWRYIGRGAVVSALDQLGNQILLKSQDPARPWSEVAKNVLVSMVSAGVSRSAGYGAERLLPTRSVAGKVKDAVTTVRKGGSQVLGAVGSQAARAEADREAQSAPIAVDVPTVTSTDPAIPRGIADVESEEATAEPVVESSSETLRASPLTSQVQPDVDTPGEPQSAFDESAGPQGTENRESEAGGETHVMVPETPAPLSVSSADQKTQLPLDASKGRTPSLVAPPASEEPTPGGIADEIRPPSAEPATPVREEVGQQPPHMQLAPGASTRQDRAMAVAQDGQRAPSADGDGRAVENLAERMGPVPAAEEPGGQPLPQLSVPVDALAEPPVTPAGSKADVVPGAPHPRGTVGPGPLEAKNVVGDLSAPGEGTDTVAAAASPEALPVPTPHRAGVAGRRGTAHPHGDRQFLAELSDRVVEARATFLAAQQHRGVSGEPLPGPLAVAQRDLTRAQLLLHAVQSDIHSGRPVHLSGTLEEDSEVLRQRAHVLGEDSAATLGQYRRLHSRTADVIPNADVAELRRWFHRTSTSLYPELVCR